MKGKAGDWNEFSKKEMKWLSKQQPGQIFTIDKDRGLFEQQKILIEQQQKLIDMLLKSSEGNYTCEGGKIDLNVNETE